MAVKKENGEIAGGPGAPSPCPSPNLQQLIKLDLPSQRTYRSDAVKSSEKRASPSWLLGLGPLGNDQMDFKGQNQVTRHQSPSPRPPPRTTEARKSGLKARWRADQAVKCMTVHTCPGGEARSVYRARQRCQSQQPTRTAHLGKLEKANALPLGLDGCGSNILHSTFASLLSDPLQQAHTSVYTL